MLAYLIAGAALVLLGAMAALISASSVRSRRLKILLRSVGAFGVLVVLAGLGLVIWLAARAPEAEFRRVSSPDGLREATTTYTPGFLGRDVTTVEIQSEGEPWTFEAFKYSGASEIDHITVKWPDNHHLEISYYSAHYGGHEYCASPATDLTVTCTPLVNGRASN